MDRPADVFNVHVAEDFAVLGDLALDVGEGKVVEVAVGGEVAVDLVGGEVVLAAGEVHLHRAGDGAQVHVTVRGVEVDSCAQSGCGHVSPAGVRRLHGRIWAR